MSTQRKPSFFNRLLAGLLRFFFHHLYHAFAWSYDLIAGIVSVGMWKDWVTYSLELGEGSEILELGHGPGHLQIALIKKGLKPYGVDESWQMSRLASRRIRKLKNSDAVSGYAQNTGLVRALAQALPFPSARFHTVVATFPPGFIFQLETLREISRVLIPGRRLVVILSAAIEGTSFVHRLAAWLFRLTGETIQWQAQLADSFREAGLELQVEWVQVRSARLLVLLARKLV